jgi:hypothetical protein
MIQVFVWNKSGEGKIQKDSYGHSSMRVVFDDLTTCHDAYMSWWPTGSGGELSGSAHITIETFENDCSGEGHKPDRTFEFKGLFDEQEVLKKWRLWKADPKYQMIYRNCSTMVAAMLFDDSFRNKYPLLAHQTAHLIWTPRSIAVMCDIVQQTVKN